MSTGTALYTGGEKPLPVHFLHNAVYYCSGYFPVCLCVHLCMGTRLGINITNGHFSFIALQLPTVILLTPCCCCS